MSSYVHSRKVLVTIVVAISVVLARHPETAVTGLAADQGCGPSMRGVDRLKADLGLDNMVAARATSLASSAASSGQAPPANAIQSLTEDSLDGLTDAGDQLDQAADEIGRQLDSMNLPRQQRAWSRGVSDMKAARSNLRSVLRQDPIAPGQNIGSLSPTGVGPRVMYEAATTYQNSVESLGSIADQSGFINLGGAGLTQGARDTPPPPNPGPDPWQEWLKRLQAQQARIRNNINGLNAARALQAGQFQQAQQNAADMQKAVQAAQDVANQLSQLAALCNQVAQQQQQQQQTQRTQPTQSTQPAQPQAPPPAVAAAAASGGGGMGAATGLLVAGAAAAGGYALYKALVCTEPDYQANLNACANSGSCSACGAFLDIFVPYCDCLEQKGQGTPGMCGEYRRDIEDFRRTYCMVPANMTKLPNPIWR